MNSNQRRVSREEAMAIKAEVDYQRLTSRREPESAATQVPVAAAAATTNMASELAPTLERLPSEQSSNRYNTEVVKFDAAAAQMGPDGDLARVAAGATGQGAAAGTGSEQQKAGLSADRFALVAPDYELVEHLIPKDSVNNKSFTDVTFIVGPPQHSKKYVGHRVLLAMTSPVFETMFYGDMADKSKYIRIADVAPIGFENLLRYAYTDSLNLGSVEDAMLTAYAAKKYLLPQLLRECLTYIEHNIGPATACVVFEFAHVLNSQQLVLQAMNLIDRQTLSVITNKSFSYVQASTVEFVANRKYLSLNGEFSLFNAVVNWALAEARRRNIGQDDWRAIRATLSESSILNAIRFLAMSQEDFARAVSKTSATMLTSSAAAASSSSNLATDGSDDSEHAAAPNGVAAGDAQSGAAAAAAAPVSKINTDDPNCLLAASEQLAIFLNLTLGDVAKLPNTICNAIECRQAPPEYFTLKRFRSSSPSLAITTTTTRSIKSISSKFQCLSENVFVVGLTIPIRLDASSYANRTPKFECHLKFTTKSASGAAHPSPAAASNLLNEFAASVQQQDSSNLPNGATLLMDTIDESLHISIARDKDCLVRLKRPILIRMGSINELSLTFQTYALDEDIVVLRTPKLRSANFSEQTDGENISWLFFKTSAIEFSEIHYYY